MLRLTVSNSFVRNFTVYITVSYDGKKEEVESAIHTIDKIQSFKIRKLIIIIISFLLEIYFKSLFGTLTFPFI